MLRMEWTPQGIVETGEIVLTEQEAYVVDEVKEWLEVLKSPQLVVSFGLQGSRTVLPPRNATEVRGEPPPDPLRGWQTLPCAFCGKSTRRTAWQVKRNKGKVYCCKECFLAHRAAHADKG